jgi:hypothetical protein
MQTFTVHEPPNAPPDRIDRAESLVFVKEGFSWGAALFGPLWLLVHRLWWPLLAYLVIYATAELVRTAGMIDPRWIGLGLLALNVLLAFEADTLRRWALDRRGWRLLGSANGRNRTECERRFFDAWMPQQPIIRASRSADAGGRRGWSDVSAPLGAPC